MKGKRIAVLGMMLIWAVTLVFLLKSRTKLTYLEYQYQNEAAESRIEMKGSGDVLEQRFSMPYGIIHGIALKVDTFQRDNNSIWMIELIQSEGNKTIYQKNYNASLMEDDSFHLFQFDRNIKVGKDEDYILRITAERVNDSTGIAFYCGVHPEAANVVFNHEEQEGAVCFAIYGGDADYWWLGYYLLLALLAGMVPVRIYAHALKGSEWKDDRILFGLLTAFAVLALWNSFSVSGTFTDEWDNIRGGMILAKGGVLYRDYVTQHTPVMYYLCSIFARLGAGSVQQFRLSYYLFQAVIWGLLSIRHSDRIGKKKMLMLAAAECILVSSVLGVQGHMILSDHMQGICMVVLLLEFLGYCQDRKIGWTRAGIVSAAVFCSIGSAFISIYAIFVVAVFVAGLEIFGNITSKNDGKILFCRSFRLVLCFMVPFAGTAAYFAFHRSLKRAFEQFYLFNREVYPQYISLGDHVLEPFITSWQKFFLILADRFHRIIASSATNVDILQLMIIMTAVAVVVTMCMKQKHVEGLCMFLVMVGSASRGYDFHGMAAWYTAVLIIFLFGEEWIGTCVRKISLPVFVLVGMFAVSMYAKALGDNLLYQQSPVSELESRVIAMTEEGEDILIDAYSCDSIYFLYKNRYPANRLCYMLPWYMDWYEQETIDDLNTSAPRIVVYHPEREAWGYRDYSNAFLVELKKKYQQLSEDPEDEGKYRVWIRKDEGNKGVK